VFVPNTRVRALPALASSLVGALLFLGWQKIYISLQVGVARYNAIYGTFASVPIFLAWLYVSWVIVLLGAELSFAFQNSATYQLEGVSDSASPRARLVLALSILRDAAHSLRTGAPRFETSAYARAHRVPIRLINHLVRMCVRHGLLAETAERQGIYVLLRAPDSVCLREIVDLVLQEGAPPETLGLLHLDPAIDQVLTSVDNGLNQSLETLTLNHLLHAAAPAAQGPHVPPAQT
jgi:membrane protein